MVWCGVVWCGVVYCASNTVPGGGGCIRNANYQIVGYVGLSWKWFKLLILRILKYFIGA